MFSYKHIMYKPKIKMHNGLWFVVISYWDSRSFKEMKEAFSYAKKYWNGMINV